MRLRPYPGKRAGVPAVSLVALAVLLMGCTAGEAGSQPSGRCDCPNTETIVRQIDWLGDASPPNRVASGTFGAAGTPHVQLRFKSFTDPGGALAALSLLVDRLEAGGLEPVVLDARKVQIRSEDASVIVTATEPFAGDTVMTVDVRISVVDNLAAAALQPFVEALGTID
jgi:hypothetical protein